jgi:D-alanyl-lipoteichoic acid acyltransferase DltB (MBOAT superfamily)
MLFNSVPFLFVFLPVALAGFFLLGSLRWRTGAVLWLALASLAFYGWADPSRLLPILLASIAFNFLVGRALLVWRSPVHLALGFLGNLVLLGHFKYAGFLTEVFGSVTGAAVRPPHVLLPIGISFFTFTQIAFLVDAYRQEASAYTPWHYLLFVTFFPHLIAGPIYHHREIIPQLERSEVYRPDAANLSLGATWLALGLAKKVLLADSLVGYVTPAFAAAAAGAPVGLADAWIAVFAFTLQLYYDFSGYSDMAIGLALMFGVRLPLNFDSPYKATSLIDFWRRWHMTLSRFLRDYLYIPLGGNRRGPARRYANLAVTMLLGGLWHGAGWTFVAWGGLHGIGLIVNHAWRAGAPSRRAAIPSGLAWGLTLGFVVLTWVPFRARDVPAALVMWAGMAGANGLFSAQSALAGGLSTPLAWLAALLAVALFAPNTQQLLSQPAELVVPARATPSRWRPTMRWALVAGLLFGVAVSFVMAHRPTEFLYFRF